MGRKSSNLVGEVKVKHPILGGKAEILRTKQSGDVWQFRMRISEENKYDRISLRTRDYQTAVSRAEDRVLKNLSDIKSGRKLFGIKLGELIDKYREWRKDDVLGGQITAGRLGTITSQLKHLKEFKGAQTKMSELDRSSLFDYAQWRRVTKGAQEVTIRNEQVTINHMMSFAFRNGYAHFDGFDFPKIRITEVSRRDTFTLQEYDELVKYMRIWVSKRAAPDDQERSERLMIRDCILIASNVMVRPGELWQLTWGDINGYEDIIDEKGQSVTLVTLQIRPEISKVRKSRLITCRGGEYLKRLRERAKFKSSGDYVFCGKDGSERYPKKKFYSAWESLMNAIGVDYKQRNVTWYSLRHFGITCRLKAGASVFDVAKIAGTSVEYIEQNYGHFDQAMARAVAMKNFTFSKDGISASATLSKDGRDTILRS